MNTAEPQSAAFAAEPFPVNLNLAGRSVLVVGGGPVAARKTASLKRAGASVTVVAPAAVPEIADDPAVRWRRRPYRAGEAGGYRLVVTATDDPDVNAAAARDGEAANVFVNSADDPANCSFALMSVLRRGDLQVTVSTSGRSPAMARWLRRRLERRIDSGHARLLDLAAEVRAEARAAFGTSESPGWDAALDGGLLESVRAGREDEARARLRRCLGLPHPPAGATRAVDPAPRGLSAEDAAESAAAENATPVSAAMESAATESATPESAAA